MVEKSLWTRKIEQEPEHSHWFVKRFRDMAADGRDVAGEARLIDALVPRQARILDAGCGSGRTGGELTHRGHTVVGVDVDPVLIDAAGADHPGPTWLVGDLTDLGTVLAEAGVSGTFDAVVAAGNVMPFLAPSTRQTVLANLRAVITPGGRAALGFGAGRGYEFADFDADAAAAGWTVDVRFNGWDLHPFAADSEFLVAVLRPSGGLSSPGRSMRAQYPAAQSAVAEPAVAESAVAEPAVAEPAVAEPAVAEPAVAEPAVAKSAVAEPAVAEPAVAKPMPPLTW